MISVVIKATIEAPRSSIWILIDDNGSFSKSERSGRPEPTASWSSFFRQEGEDTGAEADRRVVLPRLSDKDCALNGGQGLSGQSSWLTKSRLGLRTISGKSASMIDDLPAAFLDLNSADLPRQGPGDPASPRRASAVCGALADQPAVLDIGCCGPGAQTLVLANALPEAHITAIDIHQPYLDEIETRAAASASVSDRISPVNMPMQDMPFEDASFDLIWAEGSACSVGLCRCRGGVEAIVEERWLPCGLGSPPTCRTRSLRSSVRNIRI